MSPPPAGRSRWTARLLAKQVRLSPGCVSDVLRRNGLKPHLVRTYKVSRDPDFAAKVKDVVGLYLNPPEHAVVLSVDEKTSIQALERTQLPLPLTGATGTGKSYVPLRARPASVRQRLPRPLPARAPAAGGARSAPCARVHERTASEDLRRLQHGISRRCRPSLQRLGRPPPLLGPARRASPAACILRTRVAKLDVAVRASQVALGRRRRRLLRQAADLGCGAVRRRRASEQGGARIAARRTSLACRRIRSAALSVARTHAAHVVEQRAGLGAARDPGTPRVRAVEHHARVRRRKGRAGVRRGAARVGAARDWHRTDRGASVHALIGPRSVVRLIVTEGVAGLRQRASLASPRIATIRVACAVRACALRRGGDQARGVEPAGGGKDAERAREGERRSQHGPGEPVPQPRRTQAPLPRIRGRPLSSPSRAILRSARVRTLRKHARGRTILPEWHSPSALSRGAAIRGPRWRNALGTDSRRWVLHSAERRAAAGRVHGLGLRFGKRARLAELLQGGLGMTDATNGTDSSSGANPRYRQRGRQRREPVGG